MRLSLEELQKNSRFWEERGYILPKFDIAKVREKTLRQPVWIHFGAGNIFRAFLASLQQALLDKGYHDTGIIACAPFDDEVIKKVYTPYENLTLLVNLNSDGTLEKRVIASIVHALCARENFEEVERFFQNPSLQLVSFTITEKGYALKNAKGEYLPEVLHDAENFDSTPRSTMGMVAKLCYNRFIAGRYPIALVSMDNFAHNGTKLYEAVRFFAEKWVEKGSVNSDFLGYLDDKDFVSFPWTMIDKITPRPSEKIKKLLQEDGIEGVEIFRTAKGSYVAPFVNAESTGYLVIEDTFPNGRPPLEKAGVIFTDKETVDKVEKMKVCTCLNPLHTVLAVFGCLLGYESIAEEMKDDLLKAFLEKLAYEEALPVVVNPGIINPEEFLKEVLERRFPNPNIPDTPQRIATDTSQKIPIRFGETLKSYLNAGRDIKELKYIPLFFAGWLRYLMGVDDFGRTFEPSPDPMLEELQSRLKTVKIGDRGPFTDVLRPILSDSRIFGIDLFEYGLAQKVENYFKKMTAEENAVRKTLEEAVRGSV